MDSVMDGFSNNPNNVLPKLTRPDLEPKRWLIVKPRVFLSNRNNSIEKAQKIHIYFLKNTLDMPCIVPFRDIRPV